MVKGWAEDFDPIVYVFWRREERLVGEDLLEKTDSIGKERV